MQTEYALHAALGAWLHHGRFQRYPLYMLCASVYTATDCYIFGNYKRRTYKWGYFPEVKCYEDISVGQIVPTISSCCCYLGTPFAPLFSCILTALGIRAGAKEKSAVNPLFSIAYISVALYSALGISMYSLEIICVGLFSVALPIYLLGILAIGKKQGAK